MKTPARIVFAAAGLATLTCALLLGPARTMAQDGGADDHCRGAGLICTRTTVVTCPPNGPCTSTQTATYYN
jgi:hypothetical protein